MSGCVSDVTKNRPTHSRPPFFYFLIEKKNLCKVSFFLSKKELISKLIKNKKDYGEAYNRDYIKFMTNFFLSFFLCLKKTKFNFSYFFVCLSVSLYFFLKSEKNQVFHFVGPPEFILFIYSILFFMHVSIYK